MRKVINISKKDMNMPLTKQRLKTANKKPIKSSHFLVY